MAQSRFIKYRDPINSFEANEKYTGIIEPALYRGFDTITNRSGLTFNLSHDNTGEVFTKKDGTLTLPRGVWMTKQGEIIKEDAPIALAIESNVGSFERWDLVVGVHSYDSINPGGLPANYEIITGLASQTEPTLPFPETQVILGRLQVPAGATSANNITWVRRRIKQLGGIESAQLGEDNRFTGQNQENQRNINMILLGDITKYSVDHIDGANSFVVVTTLPYLDLLPNKPAGTLITITFPQATIIRGFANQVDPSSNLIIGADKNLRPINIDPASPLTNIEIAQGDTVVFRKVNTTVLHPNMPFGDYWTITSITSTNSYKRLVDRGNIVRVNNGFLQARFTPNGAGGYATDGYLKEIESPSNTPFTIAVPAIRISSNIKPRIEGFIRGCTFGRWDFGSGIYTMSTVLEITQGANLIEFPLESPLEIAPEGGGVIGVGGEQRGECNFSFIIREDFENKPVLIWSTSEQIESSIYDTPQPNKITVWGSTNNPPNIPGQNTGPNAPGAPRTFLFPMNLLDLSLPFNMRIKIKGIPTITTAQYNTFIASSDRNAWGYINFEIKTMRS